MGSESKKIANRQRHNFLLTFFDKPDKYEIKEVNDFILVRYHDNANDQWCVAIYDKESWKRSQEYQRTRQNTLI